MASFFCAAGDNERRDCFAAAFLAVACVAPWCGFAARLRFGAAARLAAVFFNVVAGFAAALALVLRSRAVLLARCGARVAARADVADLPVFFFMLEGSSMEAAEQTACAMPYDARNRRE